MKHLDNPSEDKPLLENLNKRFGKVDKKKKAKQTLLYEKRKVAI